MSGEWVQMLNEDNVKRRSMADLLSRSVSLFAVPIFHRGSTVLTSGW